MKKVLVLFGAILLARVAWAAVIALSSLGPANSTSQVTIPAGSTGVKNCITDLDVISDSTYTVRMLNGGTTIYAMTIPPSVGLVRSWGKDGAVCGSNETSMTISMSAGTYQINYKGYTRK